ncbi:uncharacterized protein LOC136027875 [Artemia franciscana]|uniref:Uncharacterized protein n=1 Tax=Artemia franciscana TaxID=6661 RepID=A0AA88HB60_ARTSF|nr:hypothetical protein QYM36_014386 [Artemia franciscana]
MLKTVSEFECYFIGRPQFESTPTLSQLNGAIRRAYFENKCFQREENRYLISCTDGILKITPLKKDEGFESDSSFEEGNPSKSLIESTSSGAHSGSESDDSSLSRSTEFRIVKCVFNIAEVIFCHVSKDTIVWVIRGKQVKLCGFIFECITEEATKKLYEDFVNEKKVLKHGQMRKRCDVSRSESILNRVSIPEERWCELEKKFARSPIIDKRRQPEPKDIIKKLERKSSFNIVKSADGVMHIEILSGALSLQEDRSKLSEELNLKFKDFSDKKYQLSDESKSPSSAHDSGKTTPKKLRSPVAHELEAVLRAQLERRATPDSLSEERKISVPEKEKPKNDAAIRRAKSICRTERPRSRSRSRPRQRLPVDVEEVNSVKLTPPPPIPLPQESQRHQISRERGRSINRRGREDLRRDPSQFQMRSIVPCVVGALPPGFAPYPPGAIMLYPVHAPPQGRYISLVPSWPITEAAYPPTRSWEDPGPVHPSEFAEIKNTKDFIEMRRRARSKSPARGKQTVRAQETGPESRSFGNRIRDALRLKKTKPKVDEASVDVVDGFEPDASRKSIRKIVQSELPSCDNKKVTFNAFATVQLMEKR